MILWISVAVTLAGALIYGFAGSKAGELGRIMFAMGLLATLLRLSGHLLELH